MSKQKKASTPWEPKVSQKEYFDFIQGLDFASLRLRSFDAKLVTDAIDTSRKVDLDIRDEPSYKMQGEKLCRVTQKLSMVARYGEKKGILLSISCRFEALYRVATPMTDDYFEVFSRTSLVLNTWPYFREFVHSATARMGIPALDLPVVRHGGTGQPKE